MPSTPQIAVIVWAFGLGFAAVSRVRTWDSLGRPASLATSRALTSPSLRALRRRSPIMTNVLHRPTPWSSRTVTNQLANVPCSDPWANPRTWPLFGRAFKRSGLARSHVSTILVGKTKSVEVSTLYRLADAAKVSRSWLAFGRGGMTDDEDDLPAPWEAAKAWFLALEGHDGKGDEARAFLADRGAALYAGGRDRSPEWWLAQLRDEFRAWRQPSKTVGVREIDDDEVDRLPKLNVRKAR